MVARKMIDFVLTWLWLAPVLYLLVGLPIQTERVRKRHERERKARALEWELIELWATRQREGLEAKLLADLRQLLLTSMLRGSMHGTTSDDLVKLLRGEVTEDVASLPVGGGDPFDSPGMWLWPLFDLSGGRRRSRRARRNHGRNTRRRGDGQR